MYILNFDRPKESLQTHHPAGTSVTLQLEYSEMVLLEHALCEYKDQGHLKDDSDDLFFYWQFHALRDILKQGAPTSWIADHYKMLFPKDQFDELSEKVKAKEQEKEDKGNGKGKA